MGEARFELAKPEAPVLQTGSDRRPGSSPSLPCCALSGPTRITATTQAVFPFGAMPNDVQALVPRIGKPLRLGARIVARGAEKLTLADFLPKPSLADGKHRGDGGNLSARVDVVELEAIGRTAFGADAAEEVDCLLPSAATVPRDVRGHIFRVVGHTGILPQTRRPGSPTPALAPKEES